MLSFSILTLLIGTVSAASIQGGSSQLFQLAPPGPSSSQLLFRPSSNISSTSSADQPGIVTLPNTDRNYEFTCNGNQYGHFAPPDIQDCLQAVHVINSGRDRIKYAERDTPERTGDVFPLPWRWMGKQASCYIQVFLLPGARIGENSLYKLREAAFALTTHCAARQGQGGIVRNIGGDNKLGLILGRYAPGGGKIQCSDSKKTYITGCRDIISGMPVDTDDLTFGWRGSGADVLVPASSQSYDRTCMMKVLTTNAHGGVDVASWYNVWEAANAAYYGCLAEGYRGAYRGFGQNHDLFVTFG